MENELKISEKLLVGKLMYHITVYGKYYQDKAMTINELLNQSGKYFVGIPVTVIRKILMELYTEYGMLGYHTSPTREDAWSSAFNRFVPKSIQSEVEQAQRTQNKH